MFFFYSIYLNFVLDYHNAFESLNNDLENPFQLDNQLLQQILQSSKENFVETIFEIRIKPDHHPLPNQ